MTTYIAPSGGWCLPLTSARNFRNYSGALTPWKAFAQYAPVLMEQYAPAHTGDVSLLASAETVACHIPQVLAPDTFPLYGAQDSHQELLLQLCEDDTFLSWSPCPFSREKSIAGLVRLSNDCPVLQELLKSPSVVASISKYVPELMEEYKNTPKVAKALNHLLGIFCIETAP